MTYFLPRNYVERLKPEAYPDEDDGIVWQCGVYELAEHRYFADEDDGWKMYPAIVDIGCGRARKLFEFNGRSIAKLIGYDCAETVAWLKENAPWLDARTVDLENGSIEAPHGSLVICSDVVEHLVTPDNLLENIFALREQRCTIILSTPDRILQYGSDQQGPPPNRSHVREWTMAEFVLLCESFGLKDGEYSYTQTNDKSTEKKTITAVFR